MDILPYMIFIHEVRRLFDKRSYEHTDEALWNDIFRND